MIDVSAVYEHDPDAAGDESFDGGGCGYLVPGNRGRMLDPRRTPVTVRTIDERRGMFEVVVEAFEDKGARWWLPIEDVSGFQFLPGSARLPSRDVQRMEQIAERFDQIIEVDAHADARASTLREIDHERSRVRLEIGADDRLRAVDLDRCVALRRGSAPATEALRRLIDAAGLAALERSLAQTYVSNPRSGEIVKGHAIVIAEMGLCPYVGKMVRDNGLFAGEGAKERRRAHVILRLAFNQELFSMLGRSSVELFRGAAIAGKLESPRPSSLVAATFSRQVAMSHFESAADVALLVRQTVPVSRLFMTFLETAAMNQRYHEAEAVLIGEQGNLAF